jgi:hypothetical protein
MWKHLEIISGMHLVYPVQKTAVVGMSHTTQKVLVSDRSGVRIPNRQTFETVSWTSWVIVLLHIMIDEGVITSSLLQLASFNVIK